MKTLKQIREEYNSQFLDLVETLPDELVLEGRDSDKPAPRSISRASPVPSSKEMPVMLIFRRVQYRVFPKGQVVALYYSNMVNKYLSIPFGRDGNLNLSESVIMDEDQLDEDWQKVNRQDKTDGLSQKAVNAYRRENPGSKLKTAVTEKNPTGKRASRRKSFCSRMGGMKKRLTSAKTANDPDSRINKALRRWNCEESFKQKLNEKRQERLDEFAPLVAAGEALAGMAARSAIGTGVKQIIKKGIGKGLGMALGAVKGAAKLATKPLGDKPEFLGSNKAQKPSIQKKSSWQSAQPKYSATTQSKLGQADVAQAKSMTTPQKQVNENKISDIRKMINEGSETKNLTINGRTVTLNSGMAKRILEVYDSVNTKNKRIVESMLNEDLESFKKLLNFSIKA